MIVVHTLPPFPAEPPADQSFRAAKFVPIARGDRAATEQAAAAMKRDFDACGDRPAGWNLLTNSKPPEDR